MSPEPVPLATLTVAARCREEILAFQRQRTHAASPCYELFRRALVTDDQQAWAALYDLYGALIVTWGRCPGLDDEDVLHETWARFLRTVPGPTFTQRFQHIGKVLAYLKCCALSVRQDAGRAQARDQRLRQALLDLPGGSTADPADAVVWQSVSTAARERLYSYVHGEIEHIVVELALIHEWPPREIAARYPAHFSSSTAVSRVKERLLRRIAGDPLLERLSRE